MIDETNPAGRLYKLLVEAKKQPDKNKIKDVWVKVLECDNDDVSVTKSVIELYALSEEVKVLIKSSSSINHELYLASFQKTQQVFFPLNLSTTWASSKQHLTESGLTRLEFCAEELSKSYSEETAISRRS